MWAGLQLLPPCCVRAGRAGVNRRGSFSLGMGMLQQTTRLVNNTEIGALEFRCVSGSAFHGGSVPPRRAPAAAPRARLWDATRGGCVGRPHNESDRLTVMA